MLKIALFLALSFTLLQAAQAKSNEDEYDESGREEATNQQAAEVVAEFLSKFATLAAATADVGAFMDRISLGAFGFLKLGLPVGTIIAGALHISSKPQSEEYRALVQLRDSMEKNFKQMLGAIELAKDVIKMNNRMIDYKNHVHVPLEDLRIQMKFFWDPAVEKDAEDVAQFKKSCSLHKLQGTPLGILNYIYTHTVASCRKGLSRKQISLLSNFVPLLRLIRMKLNDQTPKEEFDEKAPDLTIWFVNLDTKVAEKVLTNMRQSSESSASYDTVNEALSFVEPFWNGGSSEPGSPCLLQDIIAGRNFYRPPIVEFQNILRLDVIQLMVFGSICANVSFDGVPSKIAFFEKEILDKVLPIMEEVQNYVDIELENSFPKIEMGVAKAKIDEKRLPMPVIDNETIFHTTVEVMNELNFYGNRKYSRQGFITTNLPNETEFSFRCYSENCFAILDYNTLHIVVTRFDIDNDPIRAYDSYRWLFKFDPYSRTNAARFLAKFIE
ncbi:hypothetical protein niasHT_025296 [Heterodera trifolii]|uniref:Uncharacterized protein n=1 Tax=Heterodera trifolii TaxID=157864 RepID=A0ABD2KB66_9BILA